MQPSPARKEWAQLLRSRLGGECAVHAFHDEAGGTAISIFSSKSKGGVVAATIGLMDVEQGSRPEVQLRTEILMDCRAHNDVIGNILSTIAFYILKNGWTVKPGTVFESMVSMYMRKTVLPHVYFTSPFQWEDMNRVVLGDRTIFPLIAVPISEAESQLAVKDSGRGLEALWESQGTDVLDWNRKSAA